MAEVQGATGAARSAPLDGEPSGVVCAAGGQGNPVNTQPSELPRPVPKRPLQQLKAQQQRQRAGSEEKGRAAEAQPVAPQLLMTSEQLAFLASSAAASAIAAVRGGTGLAGTPQSTVAATSVVGADPQQAGAPLLQQSVSQALADLTNMRAEYIQRCAEAEQAGGTMQQEAVRQLGNVLGGQFDYAAARSALRDIQQAAKQLRLDKKGTQAAAGGAPQLFRPADTPADSYLDLWDDFQAFSDAVKLEVDARIAAAKLQPLNTGRPGERRQHYLAAGRPAAAPVSVHQAPRVARQAETQPAPVAAPAALRAAERKRERSPVPQPEAGLEPADASNRHASSGKQRGQPSAPPATKKAKAHIAFGTRCDPPRPAALKGARVVKLDASPPATAAKPKASKAVQHVAVEEASRPDMLRALASAFHPTKAPLAPMPVVAEAGVQQAGEPLRAPAPSSATNSSHLKGMLQDLTLAVQSWRQQQQAAATAEVPVPAPNLPLEAVQSAAGLPVTEPGGGLGALKEILRHHGIGTEEVHSLSGLLQGVLDSMDAIAQRAQQPPQPGETTAAARRLREQLSALDSHLAAAESALQMPDPVLRTSLAGDAAHPSPVGDGAAEQLSCQFSQLLSSTTAKLQEAQEELQLSRHLQAVASAVAAAKAPPVASLHVEPPAVSLWVDRSAVSDSLEATPSGERLPSTLCAVAAQEPAAAEEQGMGTAVAQQAATGSDAQAQVQHEDNTPTVTAMADSQVQTEPAAAYQGYLPFAPVLVPMVPFLPPAPQHQFAFAADEPIPDSPRSAASLSVEFSEAAEDEEEPPPQLSPHSITARAEVQATCSPCPAPCQPRSAPQAEDDVEQLALDLLAAASIQQYSQVMAAGTTLPGSDPWEPHTHSRGAPAESAPVEPPASLPPAAPASCDPGEPPFSEPVAKPSPPKPPRPAYNPFLASSRQQQPAATHPAETGLEGLRAHADMLALWEDYRVKLGISEPSAAPQQAQPTATTPVSTSPAGEQQAVTAEPGSVEESSLEAEPQRYQRYLWRPEYAVAEPDFFHDQHAAAVAQSGADGLTAQLEGLALHSPLPATPSSSEGLTSDSTSSSWEDDTSATASSGCTPAAIARHRAQALHYKLLRRQLGKGLQLTDSLALTEADSDFASSTLVAATPPAAAPWLIGAAAGPGQPYRPELYSPAAVTSEAPPPGQQAGGYPPPTAVPTAQPLQPAGRLLARLAAGLAPGQPYSGMDGAASACQPLHSIQATASEPFEESPSNGWRPVVCQPPPSWQPPASAEPPTGLDDHLSACSDSCPPSSRAPTLHPAPPGVDSSTSTLHEVLSPPPASRSLATGVQAQHMAAWRQRPMLDCNWSAHGLGAAVEEGSPAAADCGLGDHLSDATPSDAGSSLSFKVPAPGEVISLSRQATTTSSEEVGARVSAGVARERAGGWGSGLEALRALKSRLALSRRASS